MSKSIMVHHKKRGRGRPATGRDPAVTVRLPKPVIVEISKWCKANAIESRSEAIRRLVEYGLAAAPMPEKR
jgi:Arc/MetJ-type ribon-helix-helix transcriptional regulator